MAKRECDLTGRCGKAVSGMEGLNKAPVFDKNELL